MSSRLIVIRGNSCSGKSTVARRLQAELGAGTMLIPQDVLRREILRVKDGPSNSAIELIYTTALYGSSIGYDVIVEGILCRKYYGEMLRTLIRDFEDAACVYCFDLPFEETLRRYQSKPGTDGYGEAQLRQWWIAKDYRQGMQCPPRSGSLRRRARSGHRPG